MNKLYSFFLAPLFALAVFTAPSGEALTTWRVGDRILYRGGCHDAESMLAVAQSKRQYETFAALAIDGKCFTLRRQIGARLEEWIGGPFTDPPVRFVGSVWRVLDTAGDTEFIWLDDGSGPHPAQLDAS